MFASDTTAHAQRVAHVGALVESLNASADSWFDGTPDSVDSRTRVIARVRTAAAQHEETLEVAAALDSEMSKLADFREAIVGNDTMDAPAARTATTAPLDAFGREFVATHVNAFVADNQDAITSAEEMDIRAKNYVDAHVMGRPVSSAVPTVEAFRSAVAEHVQPEAVERTASVDTDFSDYLLHG